MQTLFSFDVTYVVMIHRLRKQAVFTLALDVTSYHRVALWNAAEIIITVNSDSLPRRYSGKHNATTKRTTSRRAAEDEDEEVRHGT